MTVGGAPPATVALDASNAGTTQVPPDQAATFTAYGRDGKVLGTTPLPPVETDSSAGGQPGHPGDTLTQRQAGRAVRGRLRPTSASRIDSRDGEDGLRERMVTSEAERPLDRLAERADVVLVDFDGPICRLFGSRAAPRIAADLRQLILSRGVVLPDELRDGDDPLELFRATAVFAPELVGVVGAALAAAEVEAAASAETTIGAFDLVAACLATGRPLAIVSNNSAAAIGAYLGRRDRARYFAAVIGRGEHPDLLKPNPAPVVQALQELKVAADAAVLVGDSVTDVTAARAAGVACIGYANKPGKAERLAAAGADAIVTDMTDLAGVLARTRTPVSLLQWVDSGGGPLIVVPTTALGEWKGASVDDDDSWGDYDRACRVDGYVGVLDVGTGQALVLADEPASTTYLPDRRIFVRWLYAASEADVVRLIPRAVKIARWEDAGTWTTSGPAELFDSGYTGDGLEHTTHLTVDLARGTYLIRTALVQPDKVTALMLVHLVEQTQTA